MEAKGWAAGEDERHGNEGMGLMTEETTPGALSHGRNEGREIGEEGGRGGGAVGGNGGGHRSVAILGVQLKVGPGQG